MKTTFTTGQLATFIDLCDQKGMNVQRFQHLLTSGHLADLFGAVTDQGVLMERKKFRIALGLEQPGKLDLRPWKTVRLKVYKTKKELATALRHREQVEYAPVNTDTYNALHTPQFELTEVEEDVRLVRLTNSDLGLEDGATPEVTIRTGLMRGLATCPTQTAPQICIDKVDVGTTGPLVIASEIMTRGKGKRNWHFIIPGHFMSTYGSGVYASRRDFYGKDQVFLFRI